jgi:hypothetical protein
MWVDKTKKGPTTSINEAFFGEWIEQKAALGVALDENNDVVANTYYKGFMYSFKVYNVARSSTDIEDEITDPCSAPAGATETFNSTVCPSTKNELISE